VALATARRFSEVGNVIRAEGEIRTHEPREGPPVFKPVGSHASVSHSHVSAMIPGELANAEIRRFARFEAPVQLECNLTG
jgi:hypothetical protein